MKRTPKKIARLKSLLKSVDQAGIATINRTVSGIIKIIKNPDETAMDLQDIIETDPPLMGNVLRIANSAYFRSIQKISQIDEAIIRIGFDALKEIALCQKLCEIFKGDDSFKDYSRSLLWKHSVAVALLGKMIFRMEFRERGDNIYTAGLLHEIGVIAEDQILHEDFRKALGLSFDENKNLADAENHVLGYHHAELGGEIAGHWNFPEELCMAVCYHHNPEDAPDKFSRIVSTLYVADFL